MLPCGICVHTQQVLQQMMKKYEYISGANSITQSSNRTTVHSFAIIFVQHLITFKMVHSDYKWLGLSDTICLEGCGSLSSKDQCSNTKNPIFKMTYQLMWVYLPLDQMYH